jgi:tartrate dehydratase alpha subunit/fumarate hydratase class I-like protein
MKATATRINNQSVSTRTPTGAPRLFQAKPGDYAKQHICMCPKGASGCSHTTALYTLLHSEAAAMQAKPAYA